MKNDQSETKNNNRKNKIKASEIPKALTEILKKRTIGEMALLIEIEENIYNYLIKQANDVSKT